MRVTQEKPYTVCQPLPSLPQFPQHRQQSRMGAHTRPCMAQESPAQGCPLAQDSCTHQVLLSTEMPHASYGHRESLMRDTFLDTGIPHRLSALWAQGSLVPSALWAKSAPTVGAVGTQGHPAALC